MVSKRPCRETWAQFDDVLNKRDEGTHEHPTTVSHFSWAMENVITNDSTNHLRDSAVLFNSNSPVCSFPQTGDPTTNILRTEVSHTAQPITDIWTPTSEQKAYYLAQFLRLQPDPRVKLGGLRAKTFFELSKLPTTELSHIWELADADCDGELTLGEFSVAMHLVVLRRNGFPVPAVLPSSLVDILTSQSVSATPSFDSARVCSDPAFMRSPSTQLSQFQVAHSHTTPTSVRQRRWSISSQSDISLAEGIMHFDTKLNSNPQLQHPIPLRARTLPMSSDNFVSRTSSQIPPAASSGSPHFPPTPPPRARLPGLLSKTPKTVKEDFFFSDNPVNPDLPPAFRTSTQTTSSIEVTKPGAYDSDSTPRSPSDFTIAQLRSDCNAVTQANEQLAVELMRLQQHRICLELLLDRLLPINAATVADSFAS